MVQQNQNLSSVCLEMISFKRLVPIWYFLILFEPQEIQCLKNCWTWTLGESESSGNNKNETNSVLKLFNTDQNSNQYFGMGCYVSSSAGKNCFLKHQKSSINCIASEDGTPCADDNRIIFEKLVKTTVSYQNKCSINSAVPSSCKNIGEESEIMTTACMVTFQSFKWDDLGKWTMSQTQLGKPPFIHEFEVEVDEVDPWDFVPPTQETADFIPRLN